MKHPELLLPIIALLLLSACGGGGATQVNSSTNPQPTPTPEAADPDLIIFDDALANDWTAAVYEEQANTTTYSPQGETENVSWAVMNSGDPSRGMVLNVEMFQVTGFADFSLQPIIANNPSSAGNHEVDLTEYIEGDLVFDFRIVSWGQNTIGLFMNMQCGWPCRSQFIPVANDSSTNFIAPPSFPLMPVEGQWYEARIPLEMLIKDNLNPEHPLLSLSNVDVISIAPPWADINSQRDIHYQLDNIRIEPGEASQSDEPPFNFLMEQNAVSIAASTDQFSSPTLQLTGRIETLTGDTFLVLDTQEETFIESALIELDDVSQQGIITFMLTPPSEIGAGIYRENITIRACKDEACNTEYRGSPQQASLYYLVSDPS